MPVISWMAAVMPIFNSVTAGVCVAKCSTKRSVFCKIISYPLPGDFFIPEMADLSSERVC